MGLTYPANICDNAGRYNKNTGFVGTATMNKLVIRYRAPLLRFFVRHSQSSWDAEELTQEVFYKILKRRDQQTGQYPESYLYTVAWSVLRDRIRRDRVRQRDKHIAFNESCAANDSRSVEEAVEGDRQYGRFLSCLQGLSFKTRNIFILSRYEGLTYTQIADHYGISPSSVEKHMIKALKEIKKALGGLTL